MHLPFIRKQFEKMLLKTTIQIPIDAPDIVSEHIFPIIGKFYRLSVRMYEMFAAEKPRHIRP